MSLHLDKMFARRMSHLLDGYEERDSKWIFRCPYCGDSKTNKRKRRGALTQKDTGLGFKCQNCQVGKGFSHFLKDQDPRLYAEFSMETVRERSGFRPAPVEEIKVDTASSTDLMSSLLAGSPTEVKSQAAASAFAPLDRISSLRRDHPAAQYLVKRGFGPGTTAWEDLYFADDFPEWRNSHAEDKEPLKGHDGRIVIPLLTERGDEIGAQGRSLSSSGLRYITVAWSKEVPRYGSHRIDKCEDVWLTEGPFDAMALENGLATLHADLSGKAEALGLHPRQTVLLFDNEPGNREVASMVRKAVESGWRVAFWRDRQIDVGKDAAKAIMELGLSQSELFRIASGPLARVELGRWLGRLA
jgi:hypothetical protein